jgi:hypothetical protein
VHILQALVCHLCSFHQFAVRTISYIHEADVVVFAVHAAESGFISPREPVGAHEVGQRCDLFEVVAIGQAAFSLIFGLDKAGGEALRGNTNVVFTDEYRAA